MKIRHGFVSNSSSSSFIISVPRGTELTLEAFHQALYGRPDNFKFGPTWTWFDQVGIDSYDAVNAILDQIKGSSQDNIERLTNTVDVEVGFKKYLKSDGSVDWEAYEEKYEKVKAAEVKRLAKLMNGKDIYTVEFSDNDSEFNSQMEHGEALNTIKGIIRYNNH